MKNNMKILIIFLTVIFLALSSTGCNKSSGGIGEPDPVSGGKVVGTNKDAPKEIESRELNSFTAVFYLYAQDDGEKDSAYFFEVKEDENGLITITESRAYNVSCESDRHIFEELQKIIEKYNWAELNGTDEYTAGLPPEYQPCCFNAVYESGESIYFRQDNDPNDPASREILKLLESEFAAHGADCF